MRSVYTFVIGVWLAISLVSCENCGPSAEPIITLSISQGSFVKIDTVYTPDSSKPMPSQPKRDTTILSLQLRLPINLNADSTRYVVQIDGRRDTVTVFYDRRTTYRNTKCGYVLDLYEPERGPQGRTTRGTVLSVTYQQNSDGGFNRSRFDTSISILVAL